MEKTKADRAARQEAKEARLELEKKDKELKAAKKEAGLAKAQINRTWIELIKGKEKKRKAG